MSFLPHSLTSLIISLGSAPSDQFIFSSFAALTSLLLTPLSTENSEISSSLRKEKLSGSKIKSSGTLACPISAPLGC
jgi:hypothetical protein